MEQPTDTPPATRIIHGDSIEVLRAMPDNSIDAVVCDPPYGLSKQPDMVEVLRHWLAGDDYKATGGGFMGKTWDSFVPGPALWREVLRVLKPGGHCVAFYGTRTYDLGVLAMRLAGFEVRDQISYVFGSGFPQNRWTSARRSTSSSEASRSKPGGTSALRSSAGATEKHGRLARSHRIQRRQRA